jgi:type VI secretion system secreted protein VgrG
LSAHHPVLPDYRLRAGPYDQAQLTVIRFRGREAMSSPYRFDILASSTEIDDSAIETELLGRPASFSWHLPHARRTFHGLIDAVRVDGSPLDGDPSIYRFVLVSSLALLAHRRRSRIFQNLTADEVVDAILGEWRLTRRWLLKRRPVKRDYCVQYGESDLAFVQRLLAEEGIFFFFEQPVDGGEASAEVLVFSDDVACYPALGDDGAGVMPAERVDGPPSAVRHGRSGSYFSRMPARSNWPPTPTRSSTTTRLARGSSRRRRSLSRQLRFTTTPVLST